ncbi:hypothetical protein GGF46_002947 [Coemansia sp. RSA 552]|nr:hypothetical protein GGF46_002947 [Coemansia sp. RSA 552]
MTNSLQPQAPELAQAIPFLAFEVRHELLLDDARALLTRVFPDWNSEDIELKQCKDGITNKLVQCTNAQANLTVLIRAYGKHTEVIIDRTRELTNMACLAQQGKAPPLYARFENGLVYGFIPGTVATSEEMGNEQWAPLIAQQLAEWGRVVVPGDRSPMLFPLLSSWIRDIPETYQDKRINDLFHRHFSVEMLEKETVRLRELLAAVDSPVVFAHNDLLSGNIVMSEAKDRVSFIDYEYATYNYRGFDIANHFNEYAGFECDYSRYPAKEAQLRWFRAYLEHIHLDASPEALERMYTEVSTFRLASHVYWGVWALVQAAISDIDFDYMDYARMRFEKYYEDKRQILERGPNKI